MSSLGIISFSGRYLKAVLPGPGIRQLGLWVSLRNSMGIILRWLVACRKCPGQEEWGCSFHFFSINRPPAEIKGKQCEVVQPRLWIWVWSGELGCDSCWFGGAHPPGLVIEVTNKAHTLMCALLGCWLWGSHDAGKDLVLRNLKLTRHICVCGLVGEWQVLRLKHGWLWIKLML